MSAAAGWLLALQLAGAAVFAAAFVLERLLRRTTAATRRGLWALAVAVALALPLTRLLLPAALQVPPGVAAAVLGVWAIGAAMLMVRLGRGWWLARARATRAAAIVDAAWARQGLAVAIKVSDEIVSPQTIGAWRPVILVPRALLAASPAERRALLAHELAHVARADCLLLLAGGVARAIYWPTPLPWRVLRELRDRAEEAADDAALRTGIASSSYAAQLLAVARAQLERAGRVAADGLRERVHRVLDARRDRSSRPRWSVPRLAAAALLCAGLVTACEARSVEANAATAADRR